MSKSIQQKNEAAKARAFAMLKSQINRWLDEQVGPRLMSGQAGNFSAQIGWRADLTMLDLTDEIDIKLSDMQHMTWTLATRRNNRHAI